MAIIYTVLVKSNILILKILWIWKSAPWKIWFLMLHFHYKNEYVHYRECKFNFWRMKKIWKILSLRLKWFIIRKIPVFSYSYPYTKDEGSTSILSCSWCQIFILWRYKHALEREKVQFLKDEKLCWTIFSFRLKKDSFYNIIYISSYFMCCP